MQDLMIRVVPVGMIRTNCYVLFLPGRSDCLVIDPGAEPETFAELDRALREHPPEYGLYGA